MVERRVVVEAERCVGSGMCALTAPEVFGQDSDGFVQIVDPQRLDTEPAIEAAGLCPSGALSIDGGASR